MKRKTIVGPVPLRASGKRTRALYPATRAAITGKDLARTRAVPARSAAVAPGIDPLPPIRIEFSDNTQEVTPVADHIRLVEEAERPFPENEQRDTPRMLTQFRKIYYDSPGWNRILIRGTWRIEQKIAKGEREKLAKERTLNVLVPDKTRSDMSHTLVGMDVANHPGGVPFTSLRTTRDAATWLGDLASVLAEVRKAVRKTRPTTQAEMNELWVDWIRWGAPGRDLLGNVDGIVIGEHMAVSQPTNGKKVSELLKEYYLSANGVRLKDERMPLFARSIGLGVLQHGRFSREQAFIEENVVGLLDCTLMYMVNNGSRAEPARKGLLGDPFLNHAAASHVLTAFVEGLKRAYTA